MSSVGPSGVYIANGNNSNYYGIGLFNISDPDLKPIGLYFPNSNYASVFYETRIDKNPYVIIGNSIETSFDEWPTGIFDWRSGQMEFAITKPGGATFGPVYPVKIKNDSYVAFLYGGNQIILMNSSNPKILNEFQTVNIPAQGVLRISDFVFYQSYVFFLETFSRSILVNSIWTSENTYSNAQNSDSIYNIINPLKIDTKASLRLYCDGLCDNETRILLSSTVLNVLDSSGIDLMEISPLIYMITDSSCFVRLYSCSANCSEIIGFSQTSLTNGNVYLTPDSTCFQNSTNASISFNVTNKMGGFIPLVTMMLSNTSLNVRDFFPVTTNISMNNQSNGMIDMFVVLYIVVIVFSIMLMLLIFVLYRKFKTKTGGNLSLTSSIYGSKKFQINPTRFSDEGETKVREQSKGSNIRKPLKNLQTENSTLSVIGIEMDSSVSLSKTTVESLKMSPTSPSTQYFSTTTIGGATMIDSGGMVMSLPGYLSISSRNYRLRKKLGAGIYIDFY